MDNVVHDSTVIIQSREKKALRSPPLVLFTCLLVFILILLEQKLPTARSRHHSDIIKDLPKSLQTPLLAQMAGQNPFTLATQLGHASLARIFLPLQQCDLFVRMDVQSLGRQARDQWARKGARGGGRVGVDAHVGPVVLVAEVVCDLEREVVEMRRMRRVSRGAVGFEEELQSRGMGNDASGRELLLLHAGWRLRTGHGGIRVECCSGSGRWFCPACCDGIDDRSVWKESPDRRLTTAGPIDKPGLTPSHALDRTRVLDA
jgi:hypothetical protein